PTKQPTPTPAPAARLTQRPTSTGAGSVHGVGFYDDDADGEPSDSETGMRDVEVTLLAQNGGKRTTRTDDTGAFGFDGLGPGSYHVSVTLPTDHVGTTDSGQDISIAPGTDTPDVVFGLIVPPPDVLRAMHGLPPDEATDEATTVDANDDEQIIALSSVTSL